MSESNLDRVRAVLDRWGEGDFGSLPDLFAPDIEFVMGSGFPDSGTYRGTDGVA